MRKTIHSRENERIKARLAMHCNTVHTVAMSISKTQKMLDAVNDQPEWDQLSSAFDACCIAYDLCKMAYDAIEREEEQTGMNRPEPT